MTLYKCSFLNNNSFNPIIYVLLAIVLFKITMVKVIGCIYKYEYQNWPYLSTNTTLFIPPRFDTSIKTQCNSDSDAYMSENDVAPSRLD